MGEAKRKRELGSEEPDHRSSGSARTIPMSFFDSLADARKTLRENSLLSLETQIELLEWLARQDSGLAYRDFMRVYGYQLIRDESQRATLGVWLRERVKDVVSKAPTYYVSPDMCEMTRMAAEEMPAESLSPKDLPTETGWLLFSKPIEIGGPAETVVGPDGVIKETGRTEKVMISAIAWEHGMVGHPEQGVLPGVSYFLFQTPRDAAVVINKGVIEKFRAETGMPMPEPVLLMGDQALPGTPLGELVDEFVMARKQGPMPIYDFSGWTYGSTWNSAPVTEELHLDGDGHRVHVSARLNEQGELAVHPVVDQIRRVLLAAWKLLNEKITQIDNESIPRTIRRRAERRMPDPGDIIVIRLRKETKGSLIVENPEEGPWWSHRWLVRGHWHKYWVGAKGDQTLVTKWVSPYIKGPEGTPLIAKDKIYSLER